MKPYVWQEGMSLEEQKNGAYWERNMLATMLAVVLNTTAPKDSPVGVNGWYKHQDQGFDGWSRVISLWNGKYTFHVPDDFDIGSVLPEIEPNWDGHTTAKKWNNVMKLCGIQPSEGE